MSNGPVSRPRMSRYLMAMVVAAVLSGNSKLGLGIGLPVRWSFIAITPVSVKGPESPSRQEIAVAGSGSEIVIDQPALERIGVSVGTKRDGSSTSPSAV